MSATLIATTSTPTAVPLQRLRAAVDPHRMLECLQREWQYPEASSLLSCRVERVYPRGAKGYVIAYELRFQEGADTRAERRLGELVAGDAYAHYRSVAGSLRKNRRRQIRGAPDDADLTWLSDPALVLRRPGLDERLHGLTLLHRPKRLSTALKTSPSEPLGGKLDGTLLTHRLGKRCVARFRGAKAASSDGGSLIAKMFATGRERARVAYDTLCGLRDVGLDDRAAIRVPRPLGWLPELDTILMEDVSREPVCCLSGPDPTAGTRAAGQALRALHGCRLDVEHRHDVDQELSILDDWVELVGAVYPHRHRQLHHARALVADELQVCRDFEPVLVHRDFHEKQVALSSRGAVLMDFDTLCLSDPAIDVGNFSAHLELARLEGRVEDVDSLTDALLEGYGSAPDEGFTARVSTHRRATLLRLACLNAFSDHRQQQVDGLLAQL